MQLQTSIQKDQIRIGCVGYLNTLPFHYGWADQNETSIIFEKSSPTTLNGMMDRGELDISLISSLAYAKNSEKYVLLPKLCIGANNLSDSVLLISKFPIDRLEAKSILLAEESLSSQVLLKILLQKLKIQPEFEVCSQDSTIMWDEGDAFLLIGDEALFFEAPADCYRYDLSQLWFDMTKHSFCFALWAVRKEYLENHKPSVNSFFSHLLTRLCYNQEHLGTLVGKSYLDLPTTKDKLVVFDKCLDYLNNLNFKLDGEMIKGLKLYFQRALEIGEINTVPELNFIEQ